MLSFLHPFYLLLFIPLICYLFYIRNQSVTTTLKFSNVAQLKSIAHRRTFFLSKFPLLSRILTISFIIIALARPQGVLIETDITSKGIDIMLALDVSGSMAAEDFKPNNRLAVAKTTIRDFIKKRQSDRIGLVIFGGDAYTQCPQTLDYNVLLSLLDSISLNDAGQGTSIGMAIVTALNRMKESEISSKIIILLTDGENNRGEISPVRAAELAKSLGIKIYTIGIGKKGGASIPYIHPLYGKIYSQEKTFLDETTLTQIASITNGRYFRAIDSLTLKKILSQINELEKSEIKSTNYATYKEWFPYFIGLALLMLILELIISNLIAIKIP